jgi:hypothetical protein
MTDREPSSGGGMTGATGDLTPDEIQRDFEPGEWREASDPAHQGDVTRSHASHAHSERGNLPPEHTPAEQDADEDRESRIGGDERQDHEDHF